MYWLNYGIIMMNPVTAQHPQAGSVTIVGGGIIGICCALALQERGLSVTVLDYQTNEKACSYGKAGVLASWSCVPAAVPGVLQSMPGMMLDPEGPLSIRCHYLTEMLPWGFHFTRMTTLTQVLHAARAMFALHKNAVNLYDQIARKASIAELIRSSNFIYAYEKPEQINLDNLEWRLREERNAKLEILNGDQLREIEPDLSSAFDAAVMLGPQGHTTNPGRLVTELSEYFKRGGGTIEKRKVSYIQPLSDGVCIDTDRGKLLTEKVVIAAGSWSRKLLQPLGLKVPLVSERGYHCTFSNPGVRVNNTIMDVRRKFVANSMEQGLRCAGVAEFAGIESKANQRREKILQQCSKHLLPELNVDQVSTWVGSRPSLPDSLPVIGCHPNHRNVLMAFGHSHTGLTAAPMTAKLITALAIGERPSIDIEAYRLDRFYNTSKLSKDTYYAS